MIWCLNPFFNTKELLKNSTVFCERAMCATLIHRCVRLASVHGFWWCCAKIESCAQQFDLIRCFPWIIHSKVSVVVCYGAVVALVSIEPSISLQHHYNFNKTTNRQVMSIQLKTILPAMLHSKDGEVYIEPNHRLESLVIVIKIHTIQTWQIWCRVRSCVSLFHLCVLSIYTKNDCINSSRFYFKQTWRFFTRVGCLSALRTNLNPW